MTSPPTAARDHTVSEAVEHYLDDVRPVLRRAVLEAVPEQEPFDWLYGPMRDYPARPSKFLRPALCLATCRAFGGIDDDVLPSAVAIELLHNFFLVQDDIADGSELRRGGSTLHTQVGMPLALTAAGGLGVMAFTQLHANYPRLGSSLGGQIGDEFLSMMIRTMTGQATELGWIRDRVTDLEPHDYLSMVANKTCWYTTIHPMRVGGLVGTWGSIDADRFVQFGLHLGAAFQIQDDILNLTGDEATYGKEMLGDLREGKRTLMLIHLARVAEGADRRTIERYLACDQDARSGDLIQEIRAMMDRYGSLDYAQAYASRISDDATTAFEMAFTSAAPGADVDFVAGLIPFMLERRR